MMTAKQIAKDLLSLVCLFVFFPFVGCGHVAINGEIVFEDGTPLPVGQVRLVGANGIARAKLNENGTFSITSVSGKKGVPAGVYKVAIEAAALPGEPLSANEDSFSGSFTAPKQLIDLKYADPDTSEIVLDTSDRRTYKIVVSKPLPRP